MFHSKDSKGTHHQTQRRSSLDILSMLNAGNDPFLPPMLRQKSLAESSGSLAWDPDHVSLFGDESVVRESDGSTCKRDTANKKVGSNRRSRSNSPVKQSTIARDLAERAISRHISNKQENRSSSPRRSVSPRRRSREVLLEEMIAFAADVAMTRDDSHRRTFRRTSGKGKPTKSKAGESASDVAT
jgi:hypothetical protein